MSDCRATASRAWLGCHRLHWPGSCRTASPGGVVIKTTLAIATIAISYATGHPIETRVDTSLPQHAPRVAVAPLGNQSTGRVWNGRWEGTTVSGHQLVLILQLQGQRVTGRLIVGKQSANITYGKVVEDAF